MFGLSAETYRYGLSRLVIPGLIICSLLFSTVTVERNGSSRAQSRSSRSQQSSQSAGALLGRGDVLYQSNDITDEADIYYKKVIKAYPNTKEAGYAQYNRGSYWQRKYYIFKERYGKEDKGALVEAEGQYYDYIDKFASRTNTIELLSDAEFNLSLVYLQKGNPQYAVGWLNRMIGEAVPRDSVVKIYKVIWSSNADDVIDRDVDALQLAQITRELINSGRSFNDVIAGVKRWAQGQGKF